MGIKDISIQIFYDSNEKEEIKKFYNDTLSIATNYDRAIGYFSSNILKFYLNGLKQFIKNKGKIRLIISPELSQDDIKAIELSNNVDLMITQKIINELPEISSSEVNVTELLTALLRFEFIELKVAFIKETHGIFHEKIGIIYQGNDYISFIGSNNETINAVENNYESFNVFKSWIPQIDEYAYGHKNVFDRHWNNQTSKIIVYDINQVLKENLLKISGKSDDQYLEIIEKYCRETPLVPLVEEDEIEYGKKYYTTPSSIETRKYQQDAIHMWECNNFKGIFQMATGSGKTLTALMALERLIISDDRPLAIVIVVPYMLLVKQWSEDVEMFTDNIICVSSEYTTWRNKISNKIRMLNRGLVKGITIITTISSFKENDFQQHINNIKKDMCIVFDECHNAGAPEVSKYLDDRFKYRLGLSATPSRFEDEEGTNKIINFFSDKQFNYTLEDAIRDGALVPYKYYPVTINLNNNESDAYESITKKIINELGSDIDETFANKNISHSLKMKLIQRAKIIYGAEDKFRGLKDIISSNPQMDRTLVYCGATYVSSENEIEEENDRRLMQIDRVCQILGNEFKRKTVKYTSKENKEEREFAINQFRSNKSNYLVAIKCLDEGVNIPEIENAIIMSSTRNPKEFIQRRGRVLRHCNKTNKKNAIIYDMIVMPDSNENKVSNKRLVINEMRRYKEFMSLAMNKDDIISDFYVMLNQYGLEEEELNYDN